MRIESRWLLKDSPVLTLYGLTEVTLWKWEFQTYHNKKTVQKSCDKSEAKRLNDSY